MDISRKKDDASQYYSEKKEISRKKDGASQYYSEKKEKFLPPDPIFNILTWVPFESLRACRCVCKSWQRITYEPHFMSQHSKRNKTIYGLFIQSMVRNRYKSTFISLYDSPEIPQPSFSSLPENVRIMASSPLGLLCCVSQEYMRIPRYYMCKPVTNEWLQIPNPKTRYFTYRMAMAVQSMEPLCYKLVRFSWPRHTKGYLICEIFNSELWAWNRSSDIRLPSLSLLLPGQGVLMKGGIHWMTTEDYIFAFHLDSQSWKMIPLPQEGPEINVRNHAQITKYRDQLALIYYSHFEMELWVLVDYSRERWERKQRIGEEAFYGKNGFSSLLTFCDTEMVLLHWIYDFIWCNYLKEKSITTKADHLAAQSVYTLESNIFPCKMRK